MEDEGHTPEPRGAWFGVSIVVFALLVGGVLSMRGYRSFERVDEWTHLPQIRLFLEGRLALEPSLPQFPSYHAVVAGIASLAGDQSLDDLRLISTLLGFLSVAAFAGCAQAMDLPRPALRTLQFAVFPLLISYRFLLYTDVVSIGLVLAMFWAVSAGRPGPAGLLALAAVSVRQTNLPWVAAAPLWGLMVRPQLLADGAAAFVRRHWTFGVAAAAFGLYVVLNGGIAATEDQQQYFKVGIYWGNLVFALVTIPVIALPLACARVIAWGRDPDERLVPLALLTLGTGAVAFVLWWQVESGYNRAIANFMHNQLVMHANNAVEARVTAMAAAGVGVLTLAGLGLDRRVFWTYLVIAAGSLLPLNMVEPRYWIPAWTVLLLLRPDEGRATEWALTLWFAALSAGIFALMALDVAYL